MCRVRAVLVIPAAIDFSPCGRTPSGCLVLRGFCRGNTYRMEGDGIKASARNPCIHAATKYPAVRNNAALGQAKSIEKLRISTVFLGF
jgi:hypothetical protein